MYDNDNNKSSADEMINKSFWLKALIGLAVVSTVFTMFGGQCAKKLGLTPQQTINIETISGDHNTFNFNNGDNR